MKIIFKKGFSQWECVTCTDTCLWWDIVSAHLLSIYIVYTKSSSQINYSLIWGVGWRGNNEQKAQEFKIWHILFKNWIRPGTESSSSAYFARGTGWLINLCLWLINLHNCITLYRPLWIITYRLGVIIRLYVQLSAWPQNINQSRQFYITCPIHKSLPQEYK